MNLINKFVKFFLCLMIAMPALSQSVPQIHWKTLCQAGSPFNPTIRAGSGKHCKNPQMARLAMTHCPAYASDFKKSHCYQESVKVLGEEESNKILAGQGMKLSLIAPSKDIKTVDDLFKLLKASAGLADKTPAPTAPPAAAPAKPAAVATPVSDTAKPLPAPAKKPAGGVLVLPPRPAPAASATPMPSAVNEDSYPPPHSEKCPKIISPNAWERTISYISGLGGPLVAKDGYIDLVYQNAVDRLGNPIQLFVDSDRFKDFKISARGFNDYSGKLDAHRESQKNATKYTRTGLMGPFNTSISEENGVTTCQYEYYFQSPYDSSAPPATKNVIRMYKKN